MRPLPARLRTVEPGRIAPVGLPRIDWRNKLTNGLSYCFVPRNGVVVDIVKNRSTSPAPTGMANGSSGQGAISAQCSNASTTDIDTQLRYNGVTGGVGTALLYCAFLPGGAGSGVFPFGRASYTAESNNGGFQIGFDGGNSRGYGCYYFSNSTFSQYPVFDSDTTYHVGDLVLGFAHYFSGDWTVDVWHNGSNTVHVTGRGAGAATTANLTIGDPHAAVYLVCGWNRLLSTAEHLSFARNPRQFLRYPNSAAPWLIGAAAPATFNPGWATGATRTIGGVF